MMLTHTQPSASFGYKSVHDLPTPPSTSRPSPPPLGYQEAAAYKTPKPDSRTHSPVLKLMSASHRGLPPPAAMALASQQSSSAGGPPHQPHHHSQPSAPPVHGAQHGQPWAALPPPPQQWQGAEESMKNWLVAKAEEEKTKQEEERTRQESLRLEQRRVEMDMLRASLGGGIPPPMVPLVFAGMTVGGPMHQATLEWAQQFMPPPQGQQHPPLLRSQRPDSPDHRHRDGAQPAHVQHGGPSAGAAPAQASASFGQYPGSPARPRGQTVSGAIGRLGSAMAGHGTNPSQSAQPGSASMLPYQAHAHGQAQAGQQDASTSIYFHHWQPPTSQAGSGSSNRPGTPSAASSATERESVKITAALHTEQPVEPAAGPKAAQAPKERRLLVPRAGTRTRTAGRGRSRVGGESSDAEPGRQRRLVAGRLRRRGQETFGLGHALSGPGDLGAARSVAPGAVAFPLDAWTLGANDSAS
ncbi:hypothetical protein DCS_07221 [Drechmeria coniospora]|uniref:Uncharacterized protein n=1 Tax=Drechmeria coniospora TaxID=98403 RepID=A0A151GDS9_DRECN|nr:hypothetical protein DCS_07221 [Drechmeria coniospora]KYK55258.1 hypothetical protein DCS_07221 [Drechmeria coniospora]